MDQLPFGQWLKRRRKSLDLTQAELANQVGCSAAMIRKIEAEERRPSAQISERLAQIFDIPKSEQEIFLRFARGDRHHLSPPVQPGHWRDSKTSVRSNLPAPLNSFIGRKKEQADVMKLIAKHRLVTLTGSGGVGKSRLSIKVGEQIAGDYINGVWLVELAPTLDPSLVPHTMALTLGLREDPKRSVLDLLCDTLRERRILLLFDNCEHVLDACAHLINALLETCPQLKILTTSREPLNMTGEAIYRVPSLGLPNQQQILDTFRNYESIQLFEERAQLVQFDFSPTLENFVSIAQICQRLDGIPLAIELAAAKVAMFSTEQIAEQLHESFNLLAQGSRTALPRHQTLRASLTWSWNLLTESEQRLMRQLSVFVGGWTLEAAQWVCDGHVLHLLNSLVSKSLIVINQRTETNVRYSFHETIRQYAREKVLEAGGDEDIRDKHLAYFASLVERAEPELYRSNQVFWFKKLDDELDNFRLALEWSLATDVAAGLRMATVLWQSWQRRNTLQELGDWLRKLLDRYPASDSLRAQALVAYCVCIRRSGDFIEARKAVEEGLQLARSLSDPQTEALSLFYLGGTFQDEDLQQRIPFQEQSLALYRTLEDKVGLAEALYGLSSKIRDDSEYSKSLVLESLQLHRDLGNFTGIAVCLYELALLTIWAGNFSSPVPWLEEARKIYHDLEDQCGEADVIGLYATIAYGQGDYQQSRAYSEEALKLYEKVGVWWSIYSSVNLAYMDLRQGDIQQARLGFAEVIQRAHKENLIEVLVWSIDGVASLQMNQGEFECAARLLAWVDAMREKIRASRPFIERKFFERDSAVIHTELDEAEFAKLSEEGRAMTVEQVVALALQSL